MLPKRPYVLCNKNPILKLYFPSCITNHYCYEKVGSPPFSTNFNYYFKFSESTYIISVTKLLHECNTIELIKV